MPVYKMTPEEWQKNYLNDTAFTTAIRDTPMYTPADWIAIQDAFAKVKLTTRDGGNYVVWYDELTEVNFSTTAEEENEPKGWETL